jgi:hypothetical protein
MKHLPDDWKEKYNDPEYDQAFNRLIGDIVEADRKHRQRNEVMGCLATVLLTAVVLIGIIWLGVLR